MKTSALSFCLLTIAIVFGIQARVSIAEERGTVLSLFLSVPSDTLEFYELSGRLEDIRKRSRRVRVQDLKNGYLRVDTSGLEGFESDVQVALYRREGSADLLVLAYEKGDSTDELVALAKEGRNWKDISQEVFPSPAEPFLVSRISERLQIAESEAEDLVNCASGTWRYVLPREGKTIVAFPSSDCLRTQQEVALFEFSFDGTKFEVASE